MVFALATGNAYYHLWFDALLVQFYPLFLLLGRWLFGARGRTEIRLLLFTALLLQMVWNTGAPLAASVLPSRPLFETLLSNRVFLSHLFYFVLGMVAGASIAGIDRRVRALPAGAMALAVAVTGAASTHSCSCSRSS